MGKVGTDRHGARLRALIAVLWRAGLRIQEVLALTEQDLDPRRGAILVRKAREADSARRAWTPGRSSSCAPG